MKTYIGHIDHFALSLLLGFENLSYSGADRELHQRQGHTVAVDGHSIRVFWNDVRRRWSFMNLILQNQV